MEPLTPQLEELSKDILERAEILLERTNRGVTIFQRLFPDPLFGEIFDGKTILFHFDQLTLLELTFRLDAEANKWVCFFGQKTTPVDALMFVALLRGCGLPGAVIFLEDAEAGRASFDPVNFASSTLLDIEQRKFVPGLEPMASKEDLAPLAAYYEACEGFYDDLRRIADLAANPQHQTGADEPEADEDHNGENNPGVGHDPGPGSLLGRFGYVPGEQITLVKKHFEPADRKTANLFMTATDIFQFISERYGEGWFAGDVAAMGKQLNKQGFESSRGKCKGIYGYFLKLVQADNEAA